VNRPQDPSNHRVERRGAPSGENDIGNSNHDGETEKRHQAGTSIRKCDAVDRQDKSEHNDDDTDNEVVDCDQERTEDGDPGWILTVLGWVRENGGHILSVGLAHAVRKGCDPEPTDGRSTH